MRCLREVCWPVYRRYDAEYILILVRRLLSPKSTNHWGLQTHILFTHSKVYLTIYTLGTRTVACIFPRRNQDKKKQGSNEKKDRRRGGYQRNLEILKTHPGSKLIRIVILVLFRCWYTRFMHVITLIQSSKLLNWSDCSKLSSGDQYSKAYLCKLHQKPHLYFSNYSGIELEQAATLSAREVWDLSHMDINL